MRSEFETAARAVASVLQREGPPPPEVADNNVASEVMRPPPRLKKLAKMRQAEQMQRTRYCAKSKCFTFYLIIL